VAGRVVPAAATPPRGRDLLGELLDRILIVNERHLRRILSDYLHHSNAARPHRALAQLAPAQAETQPPHGINLADHRIHRRPILDGLTSEYHIAA
jgi:hypothetical protein